MDIIEMTLLINQRINIRLSDGRAEFVILRISEDDTRGEQVFYIDPSGPTSAAFYPNVPFVARDVEAIVLAP